MSQEGINSVQIDLSVWAHDEYLNMIAKKKIIIDCNITIYILRPETVTTIGILFMTQYKFW